MSEKSNKAKLGRPPKQENQRKRILEQAAKIIATVGYEECSLGAIAAELKLTRPAVYHYFSTKQEIFDEIVLTIVREMSARVAAAVDANATCAEQLKAVMLAHADYFESRYWINVAGSTGYGGISRRQLTNLDEIEKYRGEYEKLLSNIIRRGVRNGEFRKVNVKTAVRAIYQLLNIMRWYDPNGSKRAVDFAVDNYELICGGLKNS